MYTVEKITYIKGIEKIHVILSFEHNSKQELTTTLLDVAACGTDFNEMQNLPAFVNACNDAVTSRIQKLEDTAAL